MNKEFQFRAWNGKEMIYQAGFCFNQPNMPLIKNECEVLIMEGIESGEIIYGGVYHDAIVMQYTGLKDKNNNKLFCGDIYSHYEKKFVVVDSVNCGVCSVELNKNLGTILEDGIVTVKHNRRDFNDIYRISKYIEVVGDIYRNSELIEKSNVLYHG